MLFLCLARILYVSTVIRKTNLKKITDPLLENGRLSDQNRIVANSTGSDQIGIGRNRIERRRSLI